MRTAGPDVPTTGVEKSKNFSCLVLIFPVVVRQIAVILRLEFHRLELALALVGRQRAQDHVDGAPDQLGLHVDMTHGREVFLHPQHDGHAQFLVRHLASAELQLHFELVPLVEELLGVADLGQVIVVVDVDAEFDLFDRAPGVRFFVLLLLGQLVAVFAEIDDAANGRVRIGRHFDEIETQFLGLAQGVLQLEDAELFVGRAIDHADFARANTVIDPDGGRLRSAGLVSQAMR